jgi:hypothetical protein
MQPVSRKLCRILCVGVFFAPTVILTCILTLQIDVKPVRVYGPVDLVHAILIGVPFICLALACLLALIGEEKYKLIWCVSLTCGMMIQCIVDLILGFLLALSISGFADVM